MPLALRHKIFALPFIILPVIAANAANPPQGQPPRFAMQKEIPLPGPVKWDYLALQPNTDHLFVSQSTQLNVVNVKTDQKIATISGLSGMHGIAFAPQLNRGFISDGKAGMVRIFNLATFKIIGNVKVGQDPDAIAYDPASRLVFTPNGDSQTLSAIDAATGKVVATLPLRADPEFLVADGKGNIFLNLNSADKIAVIDTKTVKITREMNMAPSCHGPTGLAIDKTRMRLFVSCRNHAVDVLNGRTGAVLSTLPITGFSDAMRYDPALNLAFAPSIDGKLNVIAANGETGYKIIQTVTTQPSARTMAIDQRGPRLFLSAGKITAMKPADATHHYPQPVYAPGSFHVVVVSPSQKAE